MSAHVQYLFGTVLDSDCGRPLAGLQVRLRADGKSPSSTALSGDDGVFRFDLDALGRESGRFQFEVFQGQQRLKIDKGAVYDLHIGDRQDVEIRVCPHVGRATPEGLGIEGSSLSTGKSVVGLLRRPDGSLYDGEDLQAQAYSVGVGADLGDLTALGVSPVTVGDDGKFTITYSAAVPGRMIVKILPVGSATEVARSILVRAPSAHQRIDVTLKTAAHRGPSEYARIKDKLYRAAAGDIPAGPLNGFATLGDIDINGIVIAASEVDVPLAKVAAVLAALRLAERLGMDSADAEPIYALVRRHFPRSPTRLVKATPSRVRTAIVAAAEANQIAQSFADGVDTPTTGFLAKLLAAKKALSIAQATPGSVSAVLDIGFDGKDGGNTLKSLFLDYLEEHGSDAAALWADVAADKSLGEYSDGLQRAVGLSLVTLNHAPFVAEVDAKYGASDLIEMKDADIASLIATSGVPDGVVGDSKEAPDNYLTLIRNQLERAYPSAVVHKGIRDDSGALADTKTYLTAKMDFNFDTQIDDEDIIAVLGKDDAPAVAEDLRLSQRLYRVVPEIGQNDAMAALIEKDFDGALSIGQQSWGEFTGIMDKSGLSADSLRGIYNQSRSQAGVASTFLLLAHPGLDFPLVPWAKGKTRPGDVEGDDDYAAIFGALDFCACEDCQTVLSPAAYLVDVLNWLDDRDGWDELESRRPDIGTVELSCANTNVTLPYIDLVNEILENEVADPDHKGVDAVVHDATEGTSEERALAPQYRNGKAYLALANAVRAPVLPFDQPLEEMRAYLAHLGSDRKHLVRALGPYAPTDEEEQPIAAEELGLNPAGFALVSSNGSDVHRRWGYGDDETETWVAANRYVSAILNRASIDIDQLRDLLHARHPNPYHSGSSGPREFALVGTDPCDLATLQVLANPDASGAVDPDSAAFTKMNRFLRLWRATGWSMLTLDKVLFALGLTFAGETDQDQVVSLSKVAYLCRTHGLDPVEVVSWWSTMDVLLDRPTAANPVKSLYDRVFLNPAVVGDPALSIFALNAGRTDVEATTLLSTQETRISGALGISAVDFADARTEVGSDTFSLANLSLMHRYVSLARAIGMSVVDAHRLRTTLGIDPFTSVLTAIAFLEAATRWKASGVSLDEIDYLATADAASSVRPTTESLIAMTGSVRDAVLAAGTEDVRKEALRSALAQRLGVDVATVDVLDGIDFAFYDTGAAQASDLLLDATFLGVDPATGWTDLDDPDVDSAPWKAIETIRLLSKVAMLVRRWKVSATELAAWDAAVGRWTVDGTGDQEILPFLSLPVGGMEDLTVATVASQVMATAELFALRDKFPGETDWADVIGKLYVDDTMADALADRSDLPLVDMETLVSEVGLNLRPDDPEDAVSALGLRRVIQGAKDMVRFGVTAERVISWAAAWTTYVDIEDEEEAYALAVQVGDAARSRLGVASTRPVRDRLREAQRDALIASLVDFAEPTGVNALYAKLVIDVEMGAFALTSRIRQAASSVQLFVDRCVFGLESEVSLGQTATNQWQSMRQYRVWEAGRKVLLWPENYLNPSLRDDSSPYFETLEQGLMTSEPDDDSIEDAYTAYLESLHDVANLEPMAIHHEVSHDDDGDTDVLHVLARTRGKPHKYHYRRREGSWRWTAWEKVEVDFPGDHVLLTTFNRRVIVLWPVFTDTSVVTGNEENAHETTHNNVQLGWSTRNRGTWSPGRVGAPSIEVGTNRADTTDLRFSVSEDDDTGDLIVDCSRYSPLTTTSASPAMAPRYDRESFGAFRLDSGTLDVSAEIGIEALVNDEPPSMICLNQGFATGLHAARLTVRDDDPEPIGLGASIATLMHSDSSRYEDVTLLGVADDLTTLLHSATRPSFVSDSPFLVSGSRRTFLVDPTSIHMLDLSGPVLEADVSKIGVILGGTNLLALALGQVETSDSEFVSETVSRNTPRGGNTFSSPLAELLAYMAAVEKQRQDTETGAADSYTASSGDADYRFITFYHPYTGTFLREVRRHGVFGLLAPNPDGSATNLIRQALLNDDFGDYEPTDAVRGPYPVEDVDFDPDGAYATYNWELFVHAPMLVASHLTQNGRYEQAAQWLHTIFDPRDRTMAEGARRFWKVKPFFFDPDDLITASTAVASGDADDEDRRTFERLEMQTAAWRSDPFNPYLVARIRPGAFQRAVVMQYIDNLIAWGDSLFREDTLESVNEATQVYIMAANILGPKPVRVGTSTPPAPMSFNELSSADDEHSRDYAIKRVEQRIGGLRGIASVGETDPLPVLGSAYFGVPPNPKLMAYWDTVGDRLFKIRRSMDIDGNLRQLRLFEPPIDPNLLVRARAAGVDVDSDLATADDTMPHHRFSYVIQRAMALAGSVQRLGGALLSAMEKRDAEALGLLRAGHEVALLAQVRATKVEQVSEAKEALAGLTQTKKASEARRDHYDGLIQKGLLGSEEAQFVTLAGSQALDLLAQGAKAISAGAASFPDVTSGVVGIQPVVNIQIGGSQPASAADKVAGGFQAAAGILRTAGSALAMKSSNKRREQEWKHQLGQAKIEIRGLEKQVLAAEIRLAIAQKDLANHDLQVANSKDVDDFLKSKFTSKALYSWMVGEVAGLHVRSYQLAFDMAKRAERCYALEAGVEASAASFVSVTAWDRLKEGLLAGDRLQADLERMQAAYDAQDQREFEITKHLSLSDIDASALVKLRERGTCTFRLDEAWFDLDYPGHYFRRIASAVVTLSSPSGPMTGVTAELRLLSNKLRFGNEITESYDDPVATNVDLRSVTGTPPVIATSTGADDGGVFALDLRDPKYLPFERQGVISKWELTLSGAYLDGGTPNADEGRALFDWSKVADVSLTVRYTARRSDAEIDAVPNAALKTAAAAAVATSLTGSKSESDTSGTAGLKRAFRLSSQFEDRWKKWLAAAGDPDNTAIEVPLTEKDFPFAFKDTAKITQIELFMSVDGNPVDDDPPLISLTVAMGASSGSAAIAASEAGRKFALAHGAYPGTAWTTTSRKAPGTVTITANRVALQALRDSANLSDLTLVLHYDVS